MKKNKNCIIKVDNIDLIPATTEDLQFGYDLWKLTQKEFLEKINGKWNEDNEEFEMENYKDECNTNIENNYLIKYNSSNIGWLEYKLIRKYIYIKQIHILPECQGKRIGSNILNEIIKYGRKNKKNILLDVLKYNERALKFYKKLGFKIYDENNSMFNCLEYEV